MKRPPPVETVLDGSGIILCFCCGIQAFSKDKKALVKVFRREIQQHIDRRDEIFVPAERLGQPVAQKRGQRRKDRIIHRNLDHCDGHIRGGLEGEAAVEREIPQHGQNKRQQIARPVRPAGQLVEQRKAGDLDQSGTCGKESKL